ncbi:hypothetical protein [Methylicorpusculum sp.]|uniref:hypothetical protein n=1 Tax=Methylicorpusculum sp. TaxID=2713644 RepID=UPI0027176AF8|nr:hypothetical protein [Methylicorpusculum sp.]MDO8844259.1 hypothetical protein [Methylicorpusculum sp.]
MIIWFPCFTARLNSNTINRSLVNGKDCLHQHWVDTFILPFIRGVIIGEILKVIDPISIGLSRA